MISNVITFEKLEETKKEKIRELLRNCGYELNGLSVFTTVETGERTLTCDFYARGQGIVDNDVLTNKIKNIVFDE